MARRRIQSGSKARGPAGRQRLEQKDTTHQKIYEAACKLFTEKGFYETRSADIAAEAGVSTGSIFAHFGSKAKIMTILQREQMGAYLERLRNARFEGRDSLSRIDELVEFLWTNHSEALDGMKLLRVSMSYTWSWEEEDEATYQDYLERRRVVFRTILEGADDWTHFNKCSDVDHALRLFQAVHSEVIREAAFCSDDECKARLRSALAMLLGGIGEASNRGDPASGRVAADLDPAADGQEN